MVVVSRTNGDTARARIAIAGDDAAVATMEDFVRRFCAERALGEAMTARLAVVLEELLTNSIKYAFTDAARHDVHIALEADGGRVIAVYEDDGVPFDPFAVAAPNFETPVEEWPIGRLGVHLIRHLTDRVSYERTAGATASR
ncbi:MAG: ATP-binding protein [Alphaproteobacteria bacterium]|nr:ATP-binding protein [Alphaproteobacteria bacterium]